PVATTAEVSFTAVPTQVPNARSERPSRWPITGNAKSATTLNRKIVAIENATSSSSASTSGAIVTTAVAPQIAVPHPSRSDARGPLGPGLDRPREELRRGGEGGHDEQSGDGERHGRRPSAEGGGTGAAALREVILERVAQRDALDLPRVGAVDGDVLERPRV